VEFAVISRRIVNSEVGDVALGNANVDSKNHSGKSRQRRSMCASRPQWVPLNLVMPLLILTWNVIESESLPTSYSVFDLIFTEQRDVVASLTRNQGKRGSPPHRKIA